MKKGQNLSLNAIIIAALVLLVLIILALVFTGRLKIFGGESKNCLSQGGKCRTACLETEARLNIGTGTSIGCNENQICCLATEYQTAAGQNEPITT